jgi:hypothetical protein
LSICMEPCAKPLVRSGTGSRRASVRRSMHLNDDPFSCATSTAFLAWAQYKLIHLTAWLLRSSWLIFDHNRPLQHVSIPPDKWLLDSTNTTHLLTTSLSRVPHVASHELSNCRYKRQYELVSHSLITCFISSKPSLRPTLPDLHIRAVPAHAQSTAYRHVPAGTVRSPVYSLAHPVLIGQRKEAEAMIS